MVPTGQAAEKQACEDPRQDRELKSWRCLVFCLCFFGFMAQLRPGESFITPYLLQRNFTIMQVTNEIIPVLPYSHMTVLVPIFLLTDYLRYKPILVLQCLSFVCVWLLLLLGNSVLHMQLMEVFYSITMAARIAYSSYIFSLVQPSRYQRMASYSRTAVLLGVFTSSVLGQVLLSLGYQSLNYISLGFIIFSLGLSLFLKRPKHSLFFNRSALVRGASPCELDQMHPGPERPEPGKLERVLGMCKDSFLVCMLRELVENARQPQLRLWCLWWVFNSAGYYLISYYTHVLWREADQKLNYNGAVDAASTLLSAIMSFSAGFVKIRWSLWSKLVIASVIAIQAGLVFCMVIMATNIWILYVAYVLFRGAYQFLVPIATFQIASSLSKELCALVFGINTFLATVLKTVITLVVSDRRGLGLRVREQFVIYSVYFLVLSIICFVGAVLDGLRYCRQRRHQPLPLPLPQELSPLENSVQVLSVQDGSLKGPQPSAPPLLPEDGVEDSVAGLRLEAKA
ncbi:reduced folate transporter [Arvicola amphibius]|uniref:reduced folate transporter n=1 Tax=Arvicola amphibius TaxID=1047088 RepID=UPI0018E3A026|nr:reduced folate transporter [Arvicola amphibius]XP_038197102.1 reduced folate transporter [Arvicola amphibius]XP_038197104.1 reduced folate transporter [Arvicola amphibius]XP_038197105.1 reduced folate transporter [Arvicola amphibius]